MLYIVTRDRGGRDDVMRKSPIGLRTTGSGKPKRLKSGTATAVPNK